MATVYIQLLPNTAIPSSTVPPQYVANAGTNFPVGALAFDGGSTDEICFFTFRALNYGSGNITLEIDWYADTASSGDVRFGAAIAAITPNTDTQDIETKAYATVNEANDTHLGTTGQRLHRASITISNLDSIAADDWVSLKFYREASDTVNDTLSGDVFVTLLTVSYSDT